MDKIDRLIFKARYQMKSLVPSIMAVFIMNTGDKVKKTVCYYNNGDGYSKEELFDNTDKAIESVPKNNRSYPVIHFVKASEVMKKETSNSDGEIYQRYLH
ncbi:hypothetical protein [Anaerosporobacter faecicola]|uniref:hypothetical protein n=1 Tax=Anaerosporobacter faecicola TaxID=2718714 RepID=UPI001439E86D|nr:hypothetical protein [Anaerosporobacter faecicola]